MSRDLVAFDLETTGLSPKSDRIIEIGAVRFSLDGGEGRDLQMLVDPAMPVPLAVQRLTGISDATLEGQPSPVEAVAQLADFCDGADLIGHGSLFDLAFCSKVSPQAFGRRDAMDTLELARILMPLEASHSLGRLSQALRLPHDRPHRALSDAIATAALFHLLLTESTGIAGDTFGEMRRVAAQADSPLRRFFDLVDELRGDPARRRAVPVAADTAAVPEVQSPASPWDPQQLLAGSLADASARLIGPGGPLGEHPGYEYRQAQEQMTRAVAQSLERGGRLLVEAGTGVGKTLGYLIPLALWAERGGGRVVVATNTVTLQEQLIEKDLPALQPLLPRPIRVAMLKGRSHHISLRRFRRYLRQPDVSPHGADLDTIRFKLKLLRWLELTRTGDRAELHLGGAERELWRSVEVESRRLPGAGLHQLAQRGLPDGGRAACRRGRRAGGHQPRPVAQRRPGGGKPARRVLRPRHRRGTPPGGTRRPGSAATASAAPTSRSPWTGSRS